MFDEIKIKPVEINFDEIAEKTLVSKDKEIYKQPTIMSIYEGINTIPLFTEGNISVIKGHSGTRKTTLCSILIGSMLLAGRSEDKFYSYYKSDRPILYIDTEQAEYDAQRTLKAIMAKKESNMIQYYAIAEHNSKIRAKFVQYMADKVAPAMIIIDGIRDLLLNFNDILESQELIDMLLNIKSKHNCHILNIIHLNKADGKSKGHLGAFLQEKAETVMNVSYTDTPGYSKIECEKKRGSAPFSDFEITNLRGFGEVVGTAPKVVNNHFDTEKEWKQETIAPF